MSFLTHLISSARIILLPTVNVDVNVPKSYLKNIFKFKTIEKWNCEYLATDKGNITKKIFPTISERLKNRHLVYSIFMLCNFCQDMEISEVI